MTKKRPDVLDGRDAPRPIAQAVGAVVAVASGGAAIYGMFKSPRIAVLAVLGMILAMLLLLVVNRAVKAVSAADARFYDILVKCMVVFAVGYFIVLMVLLFPSILAWLRNQNPDNHESSAVTDLLTTPSAIKTGFATTLSVSGVKLGDTDEALKAALKGKPYDPTPLCYSLPGIEFYLQNDFRVHEINVSRATLLAEMGITDGKSAVATLGAPTFVSRWIGGPLDPSGSNMIYENRGIVVLLQRKSNGLRAGEKAGVVGLLLLADQIGGSVPFRPIPDNTQIEWELMSAPNALESKDGPELTVDGVQIGDPADFAANQLRGVPGYMAAGPRLSADGIDYWIGGSTVFEIAIYNPDLISRMGLATKENVIGRLGQPSVVQASLGGTAKSDGTTMVYKDKGLAIMLHYRKDGTATDRTYAVFIAAKPQIDKPGMTYWPDPEAK